MRSHGKEKFPPIASVELCLTASEEKVVNDLERGLRLHEKAEATPTMTAIETAQRLFSAYQALSIE